MAIGAKALEILKGEWHGRPPCLTPEREHDELRCSPRRLAIHLDAAELRVCVTPVGSSCTVWSTVIVSKALASLLQSILRWDESASGPVPSSGRTGTIAEANNFEPPKLMLASMALFVHQRTQHELL